MVTVPKSSTYYAQTYLICEMKQPVPKTSRQNLDEIIGLMA